VPLPEPAPPYGRMESLKEVKIYLGSHDTSNEERADLYTSFIERGHKVFKKFQALRNDLIIFRLEM
jgi:hypothetical protein